MTGQYEQLAAKVDAFHERVTSAFPGALTCRSGCSKCCEVHLTVLPLEFERIDQAVRALPDVDKTAIKARLAKGTKDARCPLLDRSGACRVYEARPMICRSHGLPIQVGEPLVWDVCHLNFPDGPDLATLDPNMVMNVETVNFILGMMTRVRGEDPLERVDLLEGLKRTLDCG